MEAIKEDMQKSMEDIKDEVRKLTGAAAVATIPAGPVPMRHQDLAHSTYTEVVSSCLPTINLSMLTRSWVKEGQILINKDPLAITSHLHDLTECKLVSKANEALTKMMSQLAHSLSKPRAVSAKKLQNGGMVYELNNMEAAQWVQILLSYQHTDGRDFRVGNNAFQKSCRHVSG